MFKQIIIREWKDEESRRVLSDTELASLPQNPADLIDLNGDELRAVEGGSVPYVISLYPPPSGPS
jgi:mersacidin/lichenicidin family type 2 lantibiotic